MDQANTSSKKCFKCGETKPRSEFYKHPAMGDGLLGKCKACTKRDASEHRARNIDAIRMYDSLRAKLPHRLQLGTKLQKERRKKDRRKDRCHNMLLRAIARGVLVRHACVVCGNKKSHAHHESYDRPLDVVWYCAIHHSARHKQMKAEGIEP